MARGVGSSTRPVRSRSPTVRSHPIRPSAEMAAPVGTAVSGLASTRVPVPRARTPSAAGGGPGGRPGGGGGAGGAAGKGIGGGIFNAAGARLSLSGTTFSTNLARGGKGGPGGDGAFAVGGRGGSGALGNGGNGGDSGGGAGGAGGGGGIGQGGGLSNLGAVTLSGGA